MHTDEAVHAVKLGTLYDTGAYTYNPHEYHGPTLYYFTLPLLWLAGHDTYADIESEVPLRATPVVFGVGLILLLMLVGDGLGRRAALWAALLTTFSRLWFFTVGTTFRRCCWSSSQFALITFAWRYLQSGRVVWAMLWGSALGLVYATKETSVIAIACMFAAFAVVFVWGRRAGITREDESESPRHSALQCRPRHLFAAVIIAVLVSIACLSAFFTNPQAIMDSMLSFGHYLQRSTTGDSSTSGLATHRHPWYYYLQMLAYVRYGLGPWWSEALILSLGIVGIGRVLLSRIALNEMTSIDGNIHLLRFLAIYTLLMTAIYAMIHYKTPWCMLGFLHGFILMAGVGATTLFQGVGKLVRGERPGLSAVGRGLQLVVAMVLLFGVTHLGVQAYRGGKVFYADKRNPYVYAHTAPDLIRLVDRIEAVAEVSPEGHALYVNVMAPNADYWPLPWYLRRFGQVSFKNEPSDDPDAAIIIAAPSFEQVLDAKLRAEYQKEYFGLRPATLLLAYVRIDLWQAMMGQRR